MMHVNSWRVVGHARVKKYVEQRLARGGMPQAVLCVGPEGVGKRMFVHELASRLGAEPVSILERDCAVMSVQEVREFVDAMSLRPAHGSVQVAIFDHAESLTPVMANALLKTLEEPPAHAYFFLISSRPNVLPTIVSRCVQLRFGSLTDAECADILGGVYEPGLATAIQQLGPGMFLRDPAYIAQTKLWSSEWQELTRATDLRRMLLAQRLSAEEGHVLEQRLRVWLTQARAAVVDATYARRAIVVQEALRRLVHNANRKLVAEYVCLNV